MRKLLPVLLLGCLAALAGEKPDVATMPEADARLLREFAKDATVLSDGAKTREQRIAVVRKLRAKYGDEALTKLFGFDEKTLKSLDPAPRRDMASKPRRK